jgi:hypothetical protein
MSQIVPTSSHAQNLTGQTVNYFGPVLKGAHFLAPPHGKAMCPACVLRIPWSSFYLYTEYMSSILEGNSWYVYPLPAVCGGCYGASGSRLRTS